MTTNPPSKPPLPPLPPPPRTPLTQQQQQKPRFKMPPNKAPPSAPPKILSLPPTIAIDIGSPMPKQRLSKKFDRRSSLETFRLGAIQQHNQIDGAQQFASSVDGSTNPTVMTMTMSSQPTTNMITLNGRRV